MSKCERRVNHENMSLKYSKYVPGNWIHLDVFDTQCIQWIHWNVIRRMSKKHFLMKMIMMKYK